MSVPLDESRGLIGDVETGDHVDVVVTYRNSGVGPNSAKVAARDVLVLSVSEADDNGNDATATLRVNDDDAAAIAAAVDGGSVWLVLRPAVGARSSVAAVKDGQ
jgi:Flp pilus assembly protein CpaB